MQRDGEGNVTELTSEQRPKDDRGSSEDIRRKSAPERTVRAKALRQDKIYV